MIDLDAERLRAVNELGHEYVGLRHIGDMWETGHICSECIDVVGRVLVVSGQYPDSTPKQRWYLIPP